MTSFTTQHRGGSGPPLVLLHGFTDTWRTWELVLPALEREHDVLAPTLAGHAGGAELALDATADTLADEVERAMDEAGFETAHLVGNSLGGFLALQLAERGRARSVVALAPAGGWEADDPLVPLMLRRFPEMQPVLRALAPRAELLLSTPAARRQAMAFLAERTDHIPVALLAHLVRGAAACAGVGALTEVALRGYPELDPERIRCPVRIVWGTADKVLVWPGAAVRMRRDWLPQAEWIELDGVGHCPQLDVPLETAQLILGLTAP